MSTPIINNKRELLEIIRILWNRTAEAEKRIQSLQMCKDHGLLIGLADNDHPQYNYSSIMKTGFPYDIEADVVLDFDNATLTFSITPVGDSFDVWVQGTLYTFSEAQTVTITDTEGLWYIVFDNTGTLTASQVRWNISADDVALVCQVYWDAVNNQSIYTGFECHKYTASAAYHSWAHYCIGTLWDDGLAVADGGAGTLNITAGTIRDEDITVPITDGAGAGLWEQDLTPVQIPIYYRTGAAGDWRRVYNVTSNTYYAYESGGGDVYWNEFVAGAWGLNACAANAYCVYWILATTEIDEPVIAVMGQGSESPLQQGAIDNNDIANFAWGDFPAEEFKVLARILVRNAGVPYTTTQIVDYRSATIIPSSGYVTTEHGSLSGLNDDDHAQYLLLAGRAGQEIGDASKVESSSTIAQAMANAADTTVIFEIEDRDLLGEYNNATGVFTATYAGTYDIKWRVDSASVAWDAGEYWRSALSRNNATTEGNYWAGHTDWADAAITKWMRSGGSAGIYLAAADTVRIKVIHTQGAAVNTLGHEGYCFFHIARIA